MRTRFRINEPDVIYQLFDPEVVAIHLGTGAYHSLPGTAGDAFLALGPAGADLDEVAAELSTKYDVSLDTIRRDLLPFFGQMEAHSLIVCAAPAERNGKRIAESSGGARLPYSPPSLHSHTDLQELFLLDPVHDVGRAGWPNLPAAEATGEPDTDDAILFCRVAGEHIIFEQFAEETVVMNLVTGAYYSLAGPAEDAFLLLASTPSTVEICRALGSKYVVEPDELGRDIQNLLQDFNRAGLIAIDRVTAPVHTPRDLMLVRPGTGLPFSKPVMAGFEEPYLKPGAGSDRLPETAHAPEAAQDSEPVLKRRYRRRQADLLSGTANGEMVLVDRLSGHYFRLNAPAADVFDLLRVDANPEQLAAELNRKYDAPLRDLTVAVIILLFNLRRLDLIETYPGNAEASGRELDVTGPRIAFSGFDVQLHKDLADLGRPFNYQKHEPKIGGPVGRQLCSLLESWFEDACGKLGCSEAGFRIAGHDVRVRCAGIADASMYCEALSHLRAAAAESPDLTIQVWDCAMHPPGPFLEPLLEQLYTNWPAICGPRGELLGYNSGDISAVFNPGPDILNVVDAARGKAYYLKRDASELPYWEISSPFRHVFHAWFAANGLQFVHCGAAGDPEGGVLLAGKGGSGKSTAAMLCAQAGLHYAGDDYCVADSRTGRLYSLYNTGKLKGHADFERLGALKGRSRNRDSFEFGGKGKAVFFLSELWADRMIDGFPIRAIVIPKLNGATRVSLEPCSRGDALLALLPSTVSQIPAADQAACERLADLARTLPSFWLHLGPDFDRIPVAIRRALS